MKKSIRIMMIGLLIASFSAAPVAGQDLRGLESLVTGNSSSDGPGTLLLLLLKGIGLTPEQKLRVKEIVVARRERLETLFQQLQTANADLANALFVSDNLKAEELAPQVARISEVREQLLLEGLDVVLQVRQILTPEQRAKAARLKEQLQKLHGALGEIQ